MLHWGIFDASKYLTKDPSSYINFYADLINKNKLEIGSDWKISKEDFEILKYNRYLKLAFPGVQIIKI